MTQMTKILFSLLFVTPTYLLAQPPSTPAPQEPSAPLVIKGKEEPVLSRPDAEQFVDDISIARRPQQVARWEIPVCPRVEGLPDAQREAMEARLRAIAGNVGVQVAKPDCRANIDIVFVDDGRAFTASRRTATASGLNEVPWYKRDFVYKSDAPIRWWYRTKRLGSGRTNHPSRIVTSSTRVLQEATIVIDRDKVAGRPIEEIADYTALVMLAEIWPVRDFVPESSPSILRLFSAEPQADAQPQQISYIDLRLLCRLYSLPLNRSGGEQRRLLVGAVSERDVRCPGPDSAALEGPARP